MRRSVVLQLFLVVALCCSTTAAFAHHGPVTITIDEAQKKMAPVTFPHGEHGEKLAPSCDTCHHMNKGLKAGDDLSKVKKCSACHLDPKSPNIPSMREMSMTKNPFHIRCISCHKEKGGDAPTKCTGCHKKQ
ncbi:MAG: cytochrome c3 family protein [Thermoanaerobaculia bacterium]